jgi:hypothetical protein
VKKREEEAVKAAGNSDSQPVPTREHAGSRKEEEESAEQRVDETEVQQQQAVGSLDLNK